MLKLPDKITKTMKSNSKLKSIISSYGPDDKNNLYIIEIDDLNENKISFIKSEISLKNEMILFRQGLKAKVQSPSVQPGAQIASSISTSSIGFRARRWGVDGFVISGHAALNGDVTSSGTWAPEFGTVTERILNNRTDAAFVTANNNVTLSNIIFQNNLSLSPNMTQTPVGTEVMLAGRRSFNIRIGSVLQVNQIVDFGIWGQRSVTRTSYSSLDGDSGGVIYRNVNGARWVAGNHIGATRTTPTQGLFGTMLAIASDLQVNLF